VLAPDDRPLLRGPRVTGPPASDTTSRRVGLCASCRHASVITSSRDSIFYRCRRSEDDPTFRKYPVLPVVTCRGYEQEPSS
jgi:hypothetical protein